MADSVLEASLTANKQVVQGLIGDENIHEALMEIIKPKAMSRNEGGTLCLNK